jgi:Ser/Thr protein kinase RdoA (MazF antagonist)
MIDVAGNRPAFTAGDALAMVAGLYGRPYETATPLPSDRDQNFLLRGAGLGTAVLKIAGAGEDQGGLAFQNRALLHLAQQPDLAAFVPAVCRTRGGATLAATLDRDGRPYPVRLLSYLEGRPLVSVAPHTPELLWETGHLLGRVDAALADFTHPAMRRDLHWDLQHAAATIRQYGAAIRDPGQRALPALFLARYEAEVTPRLGDLRRGVIHSDGNDHNLLTAVGADGAAHISGLIDFGDMVHAPLLFEPAIAAAYLLLDKAEPLGAAARVVAGYHAALPLAEEEIDLLPTLIAIRLCISVCLSAHQQAQEPDNPYLTVSEAPAWRALARLAAVPWEQFTAVVRAACGVAPYPRR